MQYLACGYPCEAVLSYVKAQVGNGALRSVIPPLEFEGINIVTHWPVRLMVWHRVETFFWGEAFSRPRRMKHATRKSTCHRAEGNREDS